MKCGAMPVASGQPIYLSVPARAAGPVEVVVTNSDGRSGRAVLTYASPDTLDFNGEWQGWASLPSGPDPGARVVLTIRDNTAVSVRCSVCRPNENCATVSAPTHALDPAPVVNNGEFAVADSGGVSIAGKILSTTFASGTINAESCGNRTWTAEKGARQSVGLRNRSIDR